MRFVWQLHRDEDQLSSAVERRARSSVRFHGRRTAGFLGGVEYPRQEQGRAEWVG